MNELILASASPRRRELLGQLVAQFGVEPADIDETPRRGDQPRETVMRLARAKAEAVARRFAGAWALGSDTEVVLERRVLGKPADRAHASEMLARLSGCTHKVVCAVALARADSETRSRLCVTRVTFADLPKEWIEAYVSSGEPADKAGAYAIQGQAAAWITRLEGSYSSVVGLPMFETAALLRAAGLWNYDSVSQE